MYVNVYFLFVKFVNGDACLAEAAFYESLLSFIAEEGIRSDFNTIGKF